MLLSTIVVNTTIDGLFPPSTGIVSLRNAIASANSSSTETTVTFDSNVFASAETIKLSGTGLVLNATQSITITGPSAPLTIDGSALASVIQIVAARSVSLASY